MRAKILSWLHRKETPPSTIKMTKEQESDVAEQILKKLVDEADALELEATIIIRKRVPDVRGC